MLLSVRRNIVAYTIVNKSLEVAVQFKLSAATATICASVLSQKSLFQIWIYTIHPLMMM